MHDLPAGQHASDRTIERLRTAYALERLIGSCPEFVRVLRTLPSLAERDATVLVTGETGTGKEFVARAVHYLGPRAGKPFVAVNCGALADTLLEDELFGHERGAYTDAQGRRVGLLVQAHGGTLFLDEVDTLSPRAQVALLRVLQDRTFRPLGSSQEQTVDVRFIAATNAPLPERVADGSFRADLYYRLAVLTVALPPLRERQEDVLSLARHFLRKHGPVNQEMPRLDREAETQLLAHAWPGNVRELENAIVRALCLARDGVVRAADLGLSRGPKGPSGDGGYRPLDAALSPPTEVPLGAFNDMKREVVLAFERNYLVRLMTAHRGNITQAARAAGKERRELGKLLKKHRLHPRDFARV